MNEQPDTIINEAESVKLENRIIEQCALECDLAAASTCDEVARAACRVLGRNIRERKTQEDSGN